jgi:hypothetical protein
MSGYRNRSTKSPSQIKKRKAKYHDTKESG